MQGQVCDIQRFCIQDGPGIRTTVFLQGCTLRCAWCHNPETIPPLPVLLRSKDGGERLSAQPRTAQEVLSIALEDQPFYARSGGGLTISGGEPLYQADFTLALLRLAKEAGLHTALDTAGHVPWEAIQQALPFTDLFLYDYKVTQDAQAWIGADTVQSLRNLARLHQAGAAILLRCPIIPGINDNVVHLRGIARVLKDCPGIQAVQLLAYHRLGVGKYDSLEQAYSLSDTLPMSEEEKAVFLAQARMLIHHPLQWG